MTKGKPLVVRIPADLRAKVAAVAAAERRSMRNQICAVLYDWLDQRNADLRRTSQIGARRGAKQPSESAGSKTAA